MNYLFKIEDEGLTYTFSAWGDGVLSSIWLEVWDGSHLCYRKLQGVINSEKIDWENDYFGNLKKNFPAHIQIKANQLIVRIFKLKVFL